MLRRSDLRDFECLRCGQCCRLSGYVHVTAEELARIAEYIGLSVAAVRRRYITTTSLGDQTVEILRDHRSTTICIFLNKRNECTIQPVKPKQCRTFPQEWTRAGANLYCPGLRALPPEKE